MIPAVRRQKLLSLLNDKNMLLLPEIVEAMGSSESTIRRDLKSLARSGDVELLRGGGIRLPRHNMEMSINVKLQLHRQEKECIARAAAQLIYPGDVIFLDPSSVNYLMIDYIQAKDVTVMTNSITHINKLMETNITSILLGGQIKKSTCSCVGPMVERQLADLRFSKCFLGANGVDRNNGVTNHDPQEQSIKRLAIAHSAMSYFLIDSSKFNTVTMCKVADIDEQTIITDRDIPGYEDLDNILTAEE